MFRKRPRRRRVIVEGFQARFVVVQLLTLAVALAVFAGLLFGPLIFDLLTGHSASQGEIAALFLHLHGSAWPLLLGLFAALAAVFVLMSHRVAGPIYRFTVAFRDVQQGRLNIRVKTRDRDYLQTEAAELDKMIRFLGARIGAAQRRVKALETELVSVAMNGTATREDIARAVTNVHALKSDLAAFVVDTEDQAAYEPEMADNTRRSPSKASLRAPTA